VETGGRTTHGPGLGGRHEVAEMTQLHSCLPGIVRLPSR
jgi:hypothetical protein